MKRPLTLFLMAILFTASWSTESTWLSHTRPVSLPSVSATNGGPLTVSATASPTAGRVPLNVTFKGTVSGGTPPYAVLWDFDDGKTSRTLEIYHVYRFPGNFTVEFWAQDSSIPAMKQFTSLTVSAHGTGNLHVTVIDPADTLITDATVRILNAPPGQDQSMVKTNSSGIADFGTVSSGIYSIEASAPGRRNTTGTAAVQPGATTALTLVLAPREESVGELLLGLSSYVAAGVAVAVVVSYLVVRRRRTSQTRAETARKPRKTSRPKPPRAEKQQENQSREAERRPAA